MSPDLDYSRCLSSIASFFDANIVFGSEMLWCLSISITIIFLSGSDVIKSSEGKYSCSCFFILKHWSAVLKACLPVLWLLTSTQHILFIWFGFFWFLTCNCYFGSCLTFGDWSLLVCTICRTKILIGNERDCNARWVKEDFFQMSYVECVISVLFLFLRNSFTLRVKSLWYCLSSTIERF